MQYYFHGTDGEPFVGKTFHYRSDCEDLDDPKRVIDESSVPDDADLCRTCNPLGNQSDGGTETCEVELSAGGICGRERPCPYHD